MAYFGLKCVVRERNSHFLRASLPLPPRRRGKALGFSFYFFYKISEINGAFGWGIHADYSRGEAF